MKLRNFALAGLLILLFSSLLHATEDEIATSLDNACKDAPVILLAEISGTEFDGLATDTSLLSDNWYFMEFEYQVLEVLRDKTGTLSRGKNLKIKLKSNANPTGSTREVSKNGGVLTSRLPGRKEVYETMDVHPGKKVVLFLDENLTHFGWFVSPNDRLEETRKLLEK